MNYFNKFLLSLLLLGGISASAQQSVYDIISSSPVHTTLKTAIDLAGLSQTLDDNAQTFTVFAPTDDAFTKLPNGVLSALISDPSGQLTKILTYHVIGSKVSAASLQNGQLATPLNTANTLKITVKSSNEVFINQAQVVAADIDASNGVVHVIDAVLVPSKTVADAAIDNGFSTLVTAVSAAELLPALTNPFATYTVFAPTNAAFAALGSVVTDLLTDPTGDLANILLYHVLSDSVASTQLSNGLIVNAINTDNTLKITVKSADGSVFINQAMVTTADIKTANGIVHVIDAVLLPTETVVDIALNNENFSTLSAAIVATELVPALTNPAGTFTVFAPTNAAFEALGDVVNDLLTDPTGELANILLYHVVGSNRQSIVTSINHQSS